MKQRTSCDRGGLMQHALRGWCCGALVFLSACAHSDRGHVDAAPRPTVVGTTLPALAILFIGNSYTFVNDLPSMTKSLLEHSGRVSSVTVDAVVKGGATLKGQWDGNEAAARVARGGWTHVVLQGQSVEPCDDPVRFAKYAAQFAALARGQGAKVLLYGTWPRDRGDEVYVGDRARWTPQDMEACLEKGFASATSASDATLVDVGAVWMRARAERPALSLYVADHSHPTVAGTFVAASVFLHALTGTASVDAAARPAGIDAADAEWIARVADGG